MNQSWVQSIAYHLGSKHLNADDNILQVTQLITDTNNDILSRVIII